MSGTVLLEQKSTVPDDLLIHLKPMHDSKRFVSAQAQPHFELAYPARLALSGKRTRCARSNSSFIEVRLSPRKSRLVRCCFARAAPCGTIYSFTSSHISMCGLSRAAYEWASVNLGPDRESRWAFTANPEPLLPSAALEFASFRTVLTALENTVWEGTSLDWSPFRHRFDTCSTVCQNTC